MNCDNIKLMISLHIDNKLSLDEVSVLMDHLDSCEKCRQIYRDFKDMKSVLSDKKYPVLSENFTNDTMRRINLLKKENTCDGRKNAFMFLRKHVAMAACLFFIIATSVFFAAKKSGVTTANYPLSETSSSNPVSDYCINYDTYTSLDEVYGEDIISFLFVY